MASSTWNKAPRNTNGVERANSLAKDGDSKRKSLYCTMQSLYEKDEVFALQYIAADGGSKATYRSETSEEQRMKAACKKRHGKLPSRIAQQAWSHQIRSSIFTIVRCAKQKHKIRKDNLKEVEM